MENNTIKKWSTIRGLPVALPSQGRNVGVVADFFFEPGTNAVDALLVQTPLHGMRALPASGISTIEKDKVTIPNEQMLLVALPALASGNALTTYKVVGESGTQVGTVSEVWLGITPLVALRIAALDLVTGPGQSNSRAKRIGEDEILHYSQETVVIDDQDARRLR